MVIDDSKESKEEVKFLIWGDDSLLSHSHAFAILTHEITNVEKSRTIEYEVFNEEVLV